MLVDVHCHLHLMRKHREALEKLKAEKIGCITHGLDPSSNRYVLELCKKERGVVYPSIGIHPRYAVNLSEEELEKELAFIEENSREIICIGEIGLDYYRITDKDNRRKEKEVFLKLLELAEKLEKPISVHSRGAEEEVIETLGSYDLEGFLHCFTGDPKLSLKTDFYFSIPTLILRNGKLRELVNILETERILLETDSPYLSPWRRIENSPVNIKLVLAEVSQIKGLDPNHLKKRIEENQSRIFGDEWFK